MIRYLPSFWNSYVLAWAVALHFESYMFNRTMLSIEIYELYVFDYADA